MTEKKVVPGFVIEDAELLFKNFTGTPGTYNRDGAKNFCVILEPEMAEAMLEEGYPVKYLKPFDEQDDPKPYVQVKINFKSKKPPRIWMITSRGKNALDEDTCMLLDTADIVKADLMVNPYEWEVRGDSGISVYLSSLFVTIRENELDRKYADVDMVN